MRSTGLWWWIDRWRKSTAYMDMTLEEQGAYRNLLDEASLRGGPLPNDDRVLAKASGDATRWKRIRKKIMGRFTLSKDGWRNETLDEVLRESARRAQKQREYRSTHGNAAGNGRGNAVGNDRGNARGNAGGNRRGNNRRPPDPDPEDQDLGTTKI